MGCQDRHAGSGRGVAGAWAGRGGQSGWKDQASHSATPRPSHGPRKGLARRLAWEPVSASSILLCTQPSCTLQGYVLHYLGEKEDLEPTVAVLKALRQMQLGPETQRRPSSSLESIPELDETPVLELRPLSPASAPAEPEDVPAVASAPVPGPKLEPHEPSAVGPGTPVGIAPGLPEPEAGLDPTRLCAMSPWDIPGVVSCPELETLEPSGPGPVPPTGMAPDVAEPEAGPAPTSPCAMREEPLTILQFPPRLVAKQLTLICAVSGAGSRGPGWAFPVSRAAPDLPFPDVDFCDVGPRPSFRRTHLCPERTSPRPRLH
ncbi:uncharacterized protein [Manis javanica]|uniref:uncharacterized protein n=1 Tax=Manis javanica TaxID=9974 RepID=UPI003C6CF18E